MALIDIAILAAFVIHAAAAGARNRRAAARSLDDYFLAGRSLRGWQAGLSMAATQFAADTPLLVTGLIATAGIFALWQLWIYAVAFLLMGFALSAGWRRAGVLTDAELSELRYGGRAAAVLRGVKAVYFGTVLNCTVLAWVLLAAAAIAGPFLRWHEWLPAGLFDSVVAFVTTVGVPLAPGQAAGPGVWITTADNLISLVLLLAVVAAYSATGGLRGVVATDIAQIGVMLAGTAAFAWIVTAEAGGPWAIAERIREQFAGGGPGGILPDEILAFTPDRARNATPALLGMLGLLWLIQLNADGSGYLAQRTMACRSDRDARTAAVVFTATQVVLRSLLWLPLGLGLLVLFPPDPGLAPELLQADREASYVRGMAELLPPGVRGLMLTGMLAALASTVDTHLNWGASYWTHDIYRRFVCRAWRGVEPDERSLVRVARVSSVAILVLALLILTQLTSINQAWQTSLLMGAGMGVTLVLRWIWWRVTAWAEIAAAGVSLVVAPALMVLLGDDRQAERLLIVAALATAGALAAILLGPREDPRRLAAFYRKARPLGFWGPVAAAAGDAPGAGPRRLARAAGATAACALSMFCVLVGAGAWLTAAPPPVWFPWPAAWSALLLAAGAALIPLWVGLGFRGETRSRNGTERGTAT